MALTHLPNELLDIIIEYTIPRGLEGAALSCKRLHTRCIPFFRRHNELRSRFHHFQYYLDTPNSIVAAADLITLIAFKPIIAEYIRTANFQYDGWETTRALVYGESKRQMPGIDEGGAVVELFAKSAYLHEAGLNWKDYYGRFSQEVQSIKYSQLGAQFLLTLLPYVQRLVLPKSWKQDAATDAILDVIGNKAKQSTTLSQTSSLASVTRFEISLSIDARDSCDLRCVDGFLALPHINSLRGPSCTAIYDQRQRPHIPPRPPHRRIDSTLRTAHLIYCSINAAGIAEFLQHTPQLRTLQYSHCTKVDSVNTDVSETWDLCGFVNAVGRTAGAHLVEFSVMIAELRGHIAPGRASLRQFTKLVQLEYPLDLVMCNIHAFGLVSQVASSMQRLLISSVDPFWDHVLPASVARLSVKSEGKGRHEEALRVLFRRLRTNLREVHIACPSDADKAYKQECNKIVAETSKNGPIIRLKPFESTHRFHWDGQS